MSKTSSPTDCVAFRQRSPAGILFLMGFHFFWFSSGPRGNLSSSLSNLSSESCVVRLVAIHRKTMSCMRVIRHSSVVQCRIGVYGSHNDWRLCEKTTISLIENYLHCVIHAENEQSPRVALLNGIKLWWVVIGWCPVIKAWRNLIANKQHVYHSYYHWVCSGFRYWVAWGCGSSMESFLSNRFNCFMKLLLPGVRHLEWKFWSFPPNNR